MIFIELEVIDNEDNEDNEVIDNDNEEILSNVLVVPQFKHNLLSIHKLARDNNCGVVFNTTGCQITNSATQKVQATGVLVDGLYYLEENTHVASNCSTGEVQHQQLQLRILIKTSPNGI